MEASRLPAAAHVESSTAFAQSASTSLQSRLHFAASARHINTSITCCTHAPTQAVSVVQHDVFVLMYLWCQPPRAGTRPWS